MAAALLSPLMRSAARQLEASEDWEEELEALLDRFQSEAGRRPLYSVCFF